VRSAASAWSGPTPTRDAHARGRRLRHFRNRFPATPSSITFSALNTSSGFSGNPSTYFADRDGFGVFSYQTMAALSTVWWFGTYTAIA
jgi:hypothetical protein